MTAAATGPTHNNNNNNNNSNSNSNNITKPDGRLHRQVGRGTCNTLYLCRSLNDVDDGLFSRFGCSGGAQNAAADKTADGTAVASSSSIEFFRNVAFSIAVRHFSVVVFHGPNIIIIIIIRK